MSMLNYIFNYNYTIDEETKKVLSKLPREDLQRKYYILHRIFYFLSWLFLAAGGVGFGSQLVEFLMQPEEVQVQLIKTGQFYYQFFLIIIAGVILGIGFLIRYLADIYITRKLKIGTLLDVFLVMLSQCQDWQDFDSVWRRYGKIILARTNYSDPSMLLAKAIVLYSWIICPWTGEKDKLKKAKDAFSVFKQLKKQGVKTQFVTMSMTKCREVMAQEAEV